MAGTGPAPADTRRRRNEPVRGDWTELGPLEEPVLPALPKRLKRDGPWPATTRAAWSAWRRDPVTAIYSPADIAYALDTIRLHAAMTSASAGEVRLRMDALGLTPKGKRDLRVRIGEPDDEEKRPRAVAPKASARRARLSLVR